MGISSSIDIASSGLRATQAGLDVVSQNIANSGTIGYTRRVLTTTQQVNGNTTSGVTVVGATRTLDTIVQRQLRLETAGAGYTGVKASYASQLDTMFDQTSGTGTLPTLVNGLTSSLSALAANPSTYTNRSGVISAASDLASTLNSLSSQVQSLRQNAEDSIGQDVVKADGLLQQIATVNARMTSDPANAASPALQDQRDGLVDQLSQYVDLKVTPAANGSVSISTTGGLLLFDGLNATRLSFDAKASIGADSTYGTDPAKRGVGTVTATSPTGAKTDVLATGGIRSGEISAYVELRDEVLPQAQAQLDSLAAGLASALADKPVAGTAAANSVTGATGFDLDLSGLQNGNAVTLGYTQGGIPKSLTIVKAANAAAAAAATASGPGTLGVDFSGGLGSVVSRIQAALGGGFAVSNPSGSTLRILDDGATAATDVGSLSAVATAGSLSSGDVQLPLFVDGATGLSYAGFDGGGVQLAGFASRISVNPAVKSDPSKLVVYGSGTAAGDTARPDFLLQALTGTARDFPAAAGIGGSSSPFTGTVGDFANQIVATQAANANAATNLDDSQKVVLNAMQSRYSDTAGVNVDTEMTQLIQLQTAYSANARIMTAAKQMLDTLMAVAT